MLLSTTTRSGYCPPAVTLSLPIPAVTSDYNHTQVFSFDPRQDRAYDQIVPVHSNPCPFEPEKVAEAYVMGLLTQTQAIAFENHFTDCEICAAALCEIADSVGVMNAATRDVHWEPPD
jgi:hypothetical protein